MFDPNLKLKWAKSHLDLLGEKIGDFRKSNTQTVSSYDDTANGRYVIRVQIPHTDAIFDIALIVGDFVCNLRACLDHLAWQLALFSAVTSPPSKEICFPICDRDSLDTQIKIVRSTYGIPEAAVSIVKSLQPYNAGDDFQSTHLWRLNKLWNIDKHRHIAPHAVVTDWIFKLMGEKAGVDLSSVFKKHGIIMEDVGDGAVMKLPLSLKDKVEFNPNPGGVDVRFGSLDRESRTSEGIDINYSDLLEMYKFVTETVIPRFASFFS